MATEKHVSDWVHTLSATGYYFVTLNQNVAAPRLTTRTLMQHAGHTLFEAIPA
jgi:hypothetical protein